MLLTMQPYLGPQRDLSAQQVTGPFTSVPSQQHPSVHAPQGGGFSFYVAPQSAGQSAPAQGTHPSYATSFERSSSQNSQIVPQFHQPQYFDTLAISQAGLLPPSQAYLFSSPHGLYQQAFGVNDPAEHSRSPEPDSPPSSESLHSGPTSTSPPAKSKGSERSKSKLHRKLEGVDETLFSSFKLRTKTRRPTTRSVTMPVIDTRLCSALEEFIKDYQLRNLPFYIPAREKQDLTLLQQLLQKWQVLSAAPVTFQEGAALGLPPLEGTTSPSGQPKSSRPSTPPPPHIQFYPGMGGEAQPPPPHE